MCVLVAGWKGGGNGSRPNGPIEDTSDCNQCYMCAISFNNVVLVGKSLHKGASESSWKIKS